VKEVEAIIQKNNVNTFQLKSMNLELSLLQVEILYREETRKKEAEAEAKAIKDGLQKSPHIKETFFTKKYKNFLTLFPVLQNFRNKNI
jgi:hypothetical protein